MTLPKFLPTEGFHAELKAHAERYFSATGRSPKGGWRLWGKTAAIALWTTASYVALVVFAATAWQAALAGISLAFAVAAIGFNVQHDGNHEAFSERRWVNRMMGLSLDSIGGSSYVWRFKHNLLHHSYTNLDGIDNDVDVGILGRLTPGQRRLPFHRFQHLYMWPLYATVAIKWQFYDDVARVALGRVGPRRFPRPRGLDLVVFLAGKASFLSIAFVVPALFRPLSLVLAGYVAVMAIVGFVLAIVFQLAHSVEEAGHPALPKGGERVPAEWAVHQVETTVDFARQNRWLCWYVGGLNFQVVHHLFPKVSHVHYPALSAIVESVSRRFGVRYAAQRSFRGAIASHYRFLRAMGRAETSAA